MEATVFRRKGIVDQWLLEALLLVVAGFATVSSCVTGVRALTEPRLTVEGLTLATTPTVDVSSSGKFVVEPIGESVLSVFDPAVAQRALASSGWLLLGAVCAVAGWLLWRVLTSLRGGDPFEPANVRRLTVAAALVTVGGVISGVLRSVSDGNLKEAADNAFFREFGTTPLAYGGQIELTPVLVGVALGGIALVYRRAAALRHELDGLV